MVVDVLRDTLAFKITLEGILIYLVCIVMGDCTCWRQVCLKINGVRNIKLKYLKGGCVVC